jgi:hypothetical protein
MSTFDADADVAPTDYTTEPNPDDRIVIHEASRHGPDRRTVYSPREHGGYIKREEAWRQSINDWHIMGREVVSNLAVELPDE